MNQHYSQIYIWLRYNPPHFVFQVSDFIRQQEKISGVDATDESTHNNMISDIFDNEDKDKDGFISHEEFSGPKHDEL